MDLIFAYIYHELKDYDKHKNDGEDLIMNSASSRKLNNVTKWLVLNRKLKEYNCRDGYQIFSKEIAKASGVTNTEKILYVNNGYENARDVLLGKSDTLTKDRKL